jgi:AcrR family transcriptional regulator
MKTRSSTNGETGPSQTSPAPSATPAVGAHKVPTPSPDRRARRRATTRQSLIDAARRLFAARGVENTRINEITDEADVGFGSFYNHFDSKDAIVEAVLSEAIAAQGEAIDALTRQLEDPAEVVCVAHSHFVNLAREDPEWAWLLIRLDVSHQALLAALGPFARRDIARGIKTGRFQVASKRIALFAAGGALLAVMRSVLDGQAPKDAARFHAEGVLRLVGLSSAEAADVALRCAAGARKPGARSSGARLGSMPSPGAGGSRRATPGDA